MEFVFGGLASLVLYAIVARFRDDGTRKAERIGIRASRRD